MERLTIDVLLVRARERLTRLEPRLEPAEAHAAARHGAALLVDIRGDVQRERDGVIPGSIHHPRNVLEWRADPTSGHDDPRLSGDLDQTVVLVCHEGYQSSLAAATLQDLGFANATDLAGGFAAWRATGLPIDRAA